LISRSGEKAGEVAAVVGMEEAVEARQMVGERVARDVVVVVLVPEAVVVDKEEEEEEMAVVMVDKA
jgi:hypothetical protein